MESARHSTWETNTLPSVVEIEVNTLCNRSCHYCPNGRGESKKKNENIHTQIFEKIIYELSLFNFSGRLSYHLYNEPLLNNCLENLVSYAKRELPFAFHYLYTNGDFLDQNRYESLLSSGIDYFLVTRHNYELIEERVYQFVQLPDQLNLSNRGGCIKKLNNPMQRYCFAPSEMMIIAINGDILLCHEDAERNVVMGNIVTQGFYDVWNSSKFQQIRRLLSNRKRNEASIICQECDNQAYPTPHTSIKP